MTEKCTDNPRDCPLIPRVEALERTNEQHSATHREMFSRLNAWSGPQILRASCSRALTRSWMR